MRNKPDPRSAIVIDYLKKLGGDAQAGGLTNRRPAIFWAYLRKCEGQLQVSLRMRRARFPIGIPPPGKVDSPLQTRKMSQIRRISAGFC